jgi:hypothetical protein
LNLPDPEGIILLKINPHQSEAISHARNSAQPRENIPATSRGQFQAMTDEPHCVAVKKVRKRESHAGNGANDYSSAQDITNLNFLL